MEKKQLDTHDHLKQNWSNIQGKFVSLSYNLYLNI